MSSDNSGLNEDCEHKERCIEHVQVGGVDAVQVEVDEGQDDE